VSEAVGRKEKRSGLSRRSRTVAALSLFLSFSHTAASSGRSEGSKIP
jgi:hypothetical protein